LPRNVEKNCGHDGPVKLLPIEVSKGVGSAVVITLTEGAVEVETAEADSAVLVSVVVVAGAEVVVSSEASVVVVGSEEVVEVVVDSAIVVGTTLSLSPSLSPTCLFARS
jgi:hypothetical protein